MIAELMTSCSYKAFLPTSMFSTKQKANERERDESSTLKQFISASFLPYLCSRWVLTHT